MLEGKTAVITGSTSGIGLAIARNLASQKASVMPNGFGNAVEIEKPRFALLCSDAASEIRGAAMSIDAGWTAEQQQSYH